MRKEILILGGGFGIYGYLPATCEKGWNVTTLDRYRKIIERRSELENYIERVQYEAEDSLDVGVFDAIVLARTPTKQFDFLKSNTGYRGHYYLEKPLGADIHMYKSALELIQENKLKFTIAYLFRFQEWFGHLISMKNELSNVNLIWTIRKNSINSWKLDAHKGGGLLSYYGVHVLSLIVDLQIHEYEVSCFHDEDQLNIAIRNENFRSSFIVKYGIEPNFSLDLESKNTGYYWKAVSPFGDNPQPGKVDPRVASLVTYLGVSQNEELKDNFQHELEIQKLRQLIEKIV